MKVIQNLLKTDNEVYVSLGGLIYMRQLEQDGSYSWYLIEIATKEDSIVELGEEEENNEDN